MWRNGFAALVLLSLSAISAGAVDVTYRGEVPHNFQALERMIKRGSTVAVDSIAVWLRDEGYLDAAVDTLDGKVIIDAGTRYRIDTVFIESDSTFVILSNQLFTRNSLHQLTDSILTGYYHRGFFWASAKVKRIRKRHGAVSIDLRVIKGPVVTIGRTVYKGLQRTRRDLVARYVSVRAGDTLTLATIRKSEMGAAGIPFVTFLPPVTVKPHQGYTKADLEFQFVEHRQLGLEIGGGYLPDNAAGLVWHLNMSFNNLFGQGKDAAVLSERREKGRNILRIDYRQPLFLTGVDELRVQVATRDYRRQFYEFALEGAYTSRVGINTTAGFSLGWKRVTPVGEMPAYSRFSARFSMERQTLDNKMNPTRGVSLRWSLSYDHRRYARDTAFETPAATGFNETRTAVEADWYQRVLGLLIGHIGVNYRGLETDEALPPMSELFLIGGPGTIRGYRNEQFTALRALYGTLEPRLRFSQGYLFTFYDAAYFSNRVVEPSGGEDGVRTQDWFRYSFGVGLALHDAFRAVTLSLGWQPGVPFDQPRLSVEFSSDL
jgi:outer membrane protein assembly factor BamA